MSLTVRGDSMVGRVAGFDQDTGWGAIDADDGAEYPFHCTAVADGTRSIEAGTRVSFWLAPGHRGLWEAAGITPQRPLQ